MMSVDGRLCSRARRPGLQVRDYFAFDQARGDQREESQFESAGKAARISDVRRLFDLTAIHLGQSVHKLALCFHRRVLAPVELLERIDVVQSEVAREIYHFHRARQRWDDAHRLAVRQSKKNAVEAFERTRVMHRYKFEIGQLRKVRMNRSDWLAGVLVGRDDPELDLRVNQQNAQQFAAPVPRPTQY